LSPDRRLPRNRVRRGLQSGGLLLFSLLAALMFWTYTVVEEKGLKDLVVPLEFVNAPKNMVVVGTDLVRMITVEVKGSPEMLRRISEGDVEARVDLSKLERGPHVLEIGRENVRLPSSVEFVKAYPRFAHFSLDALVRSRLTFKPAFTGKPPAGLQVVTWSVDQPSVEVEGPESALQRLRTMPTQPVPLEGKAQSFQTPVVPAPPEPEITVLDPGPFVLSVKIGERRSQRSIGPVSIRVTNAGFPVTVDPPSLKVMVDGPASIVDRLTPGDFTAEVDAGGLKPASQPYQLRPAVQFVNESLGSKVDITSASERFVLVRVGRAPREGEGTGALP
jgi:YbbR domain-containing protein